MRLIRGFVVIRTERDSKKDSPTAVKGHRSRSTCRFLRHLFYLSGRARQTICQQVNFSRAQGCITLLLVSGSTSHIALEAILVVVRCVVFDSRNQGNSRERVGEMRGGSNLLLSQFVDDVVSTAYF